MNQNLPSRMLALAVAAALIPAVALPGTAQAQPYDFEGGLSYIDFSPDFGPSDSAIGLDLAWYWDGVRTAGLPLQEAAFYGRAGNVHFGYLTFDKADFDVTVLGAEYYIDRLYLAADYVRFSNGDSSDDFVLGIGYVPVDGLRLAARYVIADLGDDAISLEAKYVGLLAGGTAWGLEGNVEFVDDDFDTTFFNLAGDYYFNPALSVGLRFSYVDDDFGSDSGWGIGAKYFFTPAFSGEIEYFDEDFGDTIAVRIAARF